MPGDGHVERVLGEARADQRESRLQSSSSTRGGRQPAVGPQVAQQPPQQRGVIARGRRHPVLAHRPAQPPGRLRRPAPGPIALSPWRTQLEKTKKPKREREVGEDEPPDQDVDRRELPRHVGGHHRRREHLADARRARRRREVQQEHHQGLDQQDVHEVGVDARARGARRSPASSLLACDGRGAGSWPRTAPASRWGC